MGYEGLGDSIRATIVVDYVVRRSTVGTAAAELAKCQEARLWSMSQDPRAHTTNEGTGPDGERRQRWALQRVHAALPEGGVLLAAPEQWRLRGGERGQGLRRWPAGALQLWHSEPIRRMQTVTAVAVNGSVEGDLVAPERTRAQGWLAYQLEGAGGAAGGSAGGFLGRVGEAGTLGRPDRRERRGGVASAPTRATRGRDCTGVAGGGG